MKIFNLPDLGEGLPDAEIHEWHISEGDDVETDQLLVSMETAKAVVDVPSPRSGKIAKLYGKPGDIIKTNNPLVEFTEGDKEGDTEESKMTESAATVAGNIEVGNTVLQESASGITPKQTGTQQIKAIPAIRALAKRLHVDLSTIRGSGKEGRITAEDVKQAQQSMVNSQSTAVQHTPSLTKIPDVNATIEPIRGVRRSMVQSMIQAHREIVHVTIVDDANINHWESSADITLNIIRAVAHACQKVPALNAFFDPIKMERHLANVVNIGLAMDSADGLFVPVLKNVTGQSDSAIREKINEFKETVGNRTISPEQFQDATISISNFGVFAGRYANPIVIPPCVAIVGTGRFRQQAEVKNNAISVCKVMPISLTFDHRAVTGGEASRFLGSIIEQMEK